MNGVTFGTKHSYNDFGLILSKKQISLPDPQTESVSITGRDGDLDLTEALGAGIVRFKNRKIRFTFTVPDMRQYGLLKQSKLANYLHGQKMRIILDEEKEYYYFGRCEVNDLESKKAIGTLVVDCDVEPYKMEVNGAGQSWLWDPFSFVTGIIYKNDVTVSGSAQVNLINLHKRVSPTFTCSATGMKVTYNGTTYSLSKGENKVYSIMLQEGDNYVTFTGNGTVNISYKGGTL